MRHLIPFATFCLVTAASILPVSAQIRPGAAPAPLPAVPEAATARISPEDSLDITVLGQPDLTRTVTVLADGKIALPYLGSFQAGGLTIRELTRRITLGLSAQLKNPQVTVGFRERRTRKVSINGPVKTPGERAMGEGWGVLNLVADSGGLTTGRPEWVSAMLLRANGKVVPIDMTRLLTADPKENLPLQEGDILLVQERDAALTHVQIVGEVARPGAIPVPAGGSVAAAVAAAGGPTPRAALTRATLKRGTTEILLDLSTVLSTGGTTTNNFPLQPGDTLFIPQNKLMYAVFGAVNKAGETEYPDGGRLTVSSALARCGGWTADADLKKAAVIRPARPGQQTKVVALDLEQLSKGNLSQDMPIQPGDLLFIPNKTVGRKKATLGEVLSFVPLIGFFYR